MNTIIIRCGTSPLVGYASPVGLAIDGVAARAVVVVTVVVALVVCITDDVVVKPIVVDFIRDIMFDMVGVVAPATVLGRVTTLHSFIDWVPASRDNVFGVRTRFVHVF